MKISRVAYFFYIHVLLKEITTPGKAWPQNLKLTPTRLGRFRSESIRFHGTCHPDSIDHCRNKGESVVERSINDSSRCWPKLNRGELLLARKILRLQ